MKRFCLLALVLTFVIVNIQSGMAGVDDCPDNMVSYWTFDNSGDPGNDDFGTNDVVVSGAVWNSSGQVNGAMSFDGVDDVLTKNDGTDLNTSSGTICAWINPQTYGNGKGIRGSIFEAWTDALNDVGYLGQDTDGSIYIGQYSGDYADSMAMAPLDQWTFVCGTWDSTDFYIYLNGTLDNKGGTGVMPSSLHDYRIGRPCNYASPFNGLIDEVAIYDRALNATEIQEHHANGLADKGYCAEYTPGCGNGALDAGEDCDDGNTVNDSTCPGNCQADGGYCGDGYWGTGEECDDGNNVSGDGCSSTCQLEDNDGDGIPNNVDVCKNSNAPSGMISYWGFEETSGTTAYDSYDANPGTNRYGATINQVGQVGKAYSFDGNDDYIRVSGTSLSFTTPFAVEAWVNIDSSRQHTIVSKRNGILPKPTNYYMAVSPSGGSNVPVFQVAVGNTFYTAVGSPSISVGEWHHITGVYDGTSIHVYLDGALEDSVVLPGIPDTNAAHVYIGSQAGKYDSDGRIDEVAIYDRALDATEIQEHYANGLANKGYCEAAVCADGDADRVCDDVDACNNPSAPSGMISYWGFEETSGTEAADSYDANPGTVNGATWTSSGQVGGALGFDGTDDYVDVGDIGASPSEHTVSFWARRDTFSGGFRSVFQLRSGSSHMLWLYPNGVMGYGNVSGAWDSWGVGWTDTTSYHHIVIVSSSPGRAKLYFDGVDRGNRLVLTYTPWNSVKIGASDIVPYFPGEIDEFAVHDRAFSASEVQFLFNRSSLGDDYCSIPSGCGNGVVNAGEDCDDGNNINDSTCPANCQADGGYCGDGYWGT
jgi:cysteine-rich repeat protein